ncbi:nicotinate-nucleotide--dimethylbenzimidazole phosphoribosyltransferase [Hydrogenophaga sp. PAMC20947]|uniref:nicotinate-nucleotide--dimethylbenzimidazole phosphoribosyltransferase n=1 Tax=Hydrogenophaga sp. PAMC20947 TaxID=2565558 RepID=UPI00109DA4E3|nr:nicotinate-nucleotide--dimethylbenzimidazole phosphoribosyltransferase [Hydrogenophaga sp. PAMC20947]QCB46770.1 nicotinate-nucleotide--dimethylbenzimidazole phosphoribosyltransferase [Hydrogenophaga sp. PAMC20947]
MNAIPLPAVDETEAKEAGPEPRLPSIAGLSSPGLDDAFLPRFRSTLVPERALGRMETLALQLARIQHPEPKPHHVVALKNPQLLIFAGDHGIADEGVSHFPQETTRQRVLQILRGKAQINAMAEHNGFDLSVVDAGVASPLLDSNHGMTEVPLLERKIGYGTRNILLSPAMSATQAISALHAGMDVVRHLPGNVLALGDVGVGSTSIAALLLSRLCGVPLGDACGKGSGLDDAQQARKLEKLFNAAGRHRKSVKPMAVLASMGGFEIAMMAGAMLQAASERRVVLVDGFVGGSAALVARALVPEVMDYLVFAQRSSEVGHRLMLIHLQNQPLLDMELRMGQGMGTMLAWPLLKAAEHLIND